MKRSRLLILSSILCVFLSGSVKSKQMQRRGTLRPDHLVPSPGFFVLHESRIHYYTAVRNAFSPNSTQQAPFNRSCFFVLVLPPFAPEHVISVHRRDTEEAIPCFVLRYTCAKTNIFHSLDWHTAIRHNQLGQAPFPVEITTKPISGESVDLLQTAWSAMIAEARFKKKQHLMPDGVTYVFGIHIEGTGRFQAEASSLLAGHSAQLAIIAEKLKEYCLLPSKSDTTIIQALHLDLENLSSSGESSGL